MPPVSKACHVQFQRTYTSLSLRLRTQRPVPLPYALCDPCVQWVGWSLEGACNGKGEGCWQWWRSHQMPCTATVARPMAPLTVPSKGRNWSARARSSSPVHLPRGSNSPHSFTNTNLQYSPRIAIEVEFPLRPRGKRSALDAFSPTTATFDHDQPAKRPISLVVEIPQSSASSIHTPSPLESLQSFFKLSLGSSPALSQYAEGNAVLASAQHIPPQTLIASYRLDPTETRSKGMFCTDLVICLCMLTKRPSTSSSILWRVLHGRHRR
jgi:hypothetical protein